MKTVLLSATALMLGASTPAFAGITVDGTRDAAYGAVKSTVGYDPNALDSNFGSPQNVSKYSSYSISGAIDGDTLYGFWQATPTQPGESVVGPFVNLYLDTNPDSATPDGSDVGFEITNDRAFVPGVSTGGPNNDGYSSPLGLSFYASGNVVEFAIPLALLRDGIASLPNFTADDFIAPGGRFTFRLSQAFGYSVAGGPSYGDNRLGSFTAPGGVPEPATWAMMLGGFGLAGAAMRRRARMALVSA